MQTHSTGRPRGSLPITTRLAQSGQDRAREVMTAIASAPARARTTVSTNHKAFMPPIVLRAGDTAHAAARARSIPYRARHSSWILLASSRP
jgi:hypothetical protein